MATVQELIDLLTKLDPELPVYFNEASYGLTEIGRADVETVETHRIERDDSGLGHRMIVQLTE
ncbi:hypothetical protein J7E68_15195 [Microbacterium sp. ISL-103]|uniref:hypothetical protein n=1 Tax=Microbacterium sp. ISL-103 TaxID=2819156 RepID=UPI001BE628FF|nr:hypothetical protein [Microbacterium sp. ISL-103]MBT2475883.1 hypothetical protein [Microbacterium sp. ISL-103]